MVKLVRLAPISYDRAREVREWVTSLTFSRPLQNIARDTANAWLPAEVIRTYFPRIVDLHNYPQAQSSLQREVNWDTLNVKVLKRLGFQFLKPDLERVINCDPDAALQALSTIKYYADTYYEAGLKPARQTGMAQAEEAGHAAQTLKQLDLEAQQLRKKLSKLQQELDTLQRTSTRQDFQINRLNKKLSAVGLH